MITDPAASVPCCRFAAPVRIGFMRQRPISEDGPPAVLARREAKLFDRLAQPQRREVFLAAALTDCRSYRLALEVAVLVADDAGERCGLACTSTLALWGPPSTQRPIAR